METLQTPPLRPSPQVRTQSALAMLCSPIWLLTIAPCQAQLAQEQIPPPEINHSWIGIAIIFLLVLQSLLIIGLQRSRLNNKRARLSLRQEQIQLEERINERTQSLHKINNLLVDEVARHEATGFLLRETKEYLQSIINSMPSIIIGVDARGQITHWNAAAENNFEIFSTDALNQNITQVLPRFPISTPKIQQIIRDGEPRSLEHMETNSEGANQYFDITIYPLISIAKPGAVIRIDDVTLRLTIENMMIQNEKMYSLGEVAAGIAHEINNPIGAILQNLQNVNRRLDANFPANQQLATTLQLDLHKLEQYLQQREIYQLLDSIRDAGERSASIVTNMLAFTRSGARGNAWVDINKLIAQTLELNSNLYDAANEGKLPNINLELTPELPPIRGSASELQQVLLNLLRNATQALAKKADQTSPQILLKTYLQPPSLVIEIQDNGPGMTDNIRRHIFEPFFTTKSVGSGTGLGLSIAYFIVTERHQGSIDVKSAAGLGSTFSIRLPLANLSEKPGL